MPVWQPSAECHQVEQDLENHQDIIADACSENSQDDIDNSFFTKSNAIKKKDFEDFQDLNDEEESSNKFVKIFIVILLIIFIIGIIILVKSFI